MAQFQLKLNKTDSMMLGIILKENKYKIFQVLLEEVEYEEEHLYRTQNMILDKYLEDLSNQLIDFGTDERFFKREKGLPVRQSNFYQRLKIKVFGNEKGYLGLSKTKRLKVLQKFGIQEIKANKEYKGQIDLSKIAEYMKKSKQLELTEIIEEIKQENQLKP